ncbi:unnamed protein product [Allacma fusca]|uniref:Cytochrome P450 n=1 Tax=Allacma fusca TaxID=39272 RepID=A0A8J2P8Z6_9HEXA|nr:unnamed protein product [Allacma fusca]
MLLVLFELAIGFFLAAILGLLIYARWNYGTLEALNIPVVERSFLLGSTPDLHSKVQHLEDIARFKKYGPVYGLYEGRIPHIHICDPELIRLIFVKDFDHFRNRREVSLGHPILDEVLDFLPYDKWKALRQMTTPSLTSSKLKMMSVRLNQSAVEFVPHLQKQINNAGGRMKTDSRKIFVPIAVDTIIRGLMGMNVQNPFDYDGDICQNLEGISAEGKDATFMYTLRATFPFLTKLAPAFNPNSVNFFANFFRGAVKIRAGDSIRQNDFMDKFIDMMNKLDTDEFNRLNITEDTVMGQVVGPLIAGYDAVATCCSFLSYYAANDPEVQERIEREVDAHMEKHGEFKDVEFILSLHYAAASMEKLH